MAKTQPAPSPAPERLELAEARAGVIAARAAVQRLQDALDSFWQRKRDARLEVEAAEAGIAEAQQQHVVDLVAEAQGRARAIPTMPTAKARLQAALEARDATLDAEASIRGALNSANFDLHQAERRLSAAEHAVLLPSLAGVLQTFLDARTAFQLAAAEMSVLSPLVSKRRRATWPSDIEDAVRNATNQRLDTPDHAGEPAFAAAQAKWDAVVESLAADPYAELPK